MSAPEPPAGHQLRAEGRRWTIIGSGFVASSVIAALEQDGVTPTVVHAPRLQLDPGRNLTSVLESIAAGSYDDVIATLTAAMDDCDVLVNAAGLARPGAPSSAELTGANALLPAVLLLAADRARVRRFLHVSSAAAQGRIGLLDETRTTAPTSAYGASKAMGEKLLLAVRDRYVSSTAVTILRATSVQGVSRQTSHQLAAVARSPLASVAGDGAAPTPVSTVDGLARAVTWLGDLERRPPEIVLQPWEGRTARSVLREYGDKEPRRLPSVVCRFAVRAGYRISRWANWPGAAAHVRRVELMWFGQAQVPGWLIENGFPVDQSKIMAARTSVLFGATAALTARVFMIDQCQYLAHQGWQVHLVSADGPERMVSAEQAFTWHTLAMVRPVSPHRDLVALARWVRLVRRIRPAIVMCGTPKAGLLGMLAARILRTPVRVYLVRGLRAEGLAGVARAVSLASEWIACRCSTDVVAVSHGLRARIERDHLNAGRVVTVIGAGGSNGVDTRRFRPPTTTDDVESQAALRQALGLEQRIVIGFVGRLTTGKGLAAAVAVVRRLNAGGDVARLLIVGDFEAEHPIPARLRADLDRPYVVRVGRVLDTAPYYRAMDVYLHLSSFEGLSNAILEASASGLPVVTSEATGGPDAVKDGETGYVVPLGDEDVAFERVRALAAAPELRNRLGSEGRDFVCSTFSHEVVWSNLDEYLSQRLVRM